MAAYRESKQRKILLEYLGRTNVHPTAATLFAWVRPQIPKLSLGTVYRNLGILKAQGKVCELRGNGKQSRFDADLQPHAHFYCNQCDAVYDLPLTSAVEKNLCSLMPQGHLAETMAVEIKGVCVKCRRSRKKTGGKHE